MNTRNNDGKMCDNNNKIAIRSLGFKSAGYVTSKICQYSFYFCALSGL